LGDIASIRPNLAIVPEYRPLKFISIKPGFAYAPDFTSQFTDGSYYTNSLDRQDLAAVNYDRFGSIMGFVGIGLCPNLTKSLALAIDLKYVISPAITDSPDQIAAGYRAFGISAGLMYSLQE
jgi:hypothetical protein